MWLTIAAAPDHEEVREVVPAVFVDDLCDLLQTEAKVRQVQIQGTTALPVTYSCTLPSAPLVRTAFRALASTLSQCGPGSCLFVHAEGRGAEGGGFRLSVRALSPELVTTHFTELDFRSTC